MSWKTPRTTHPYFIELSESDIAELLALYAQLKASDGQLLNVRLLAAQLGQLKGLPHGSVLRFLGYFAILESLLTHVPKPSDPYDSITRQVKKKLTLLSRRFSHPLDYSPFGDTPPETVWTKMYNYRSLIAHGVSPGFEGDLQLLRNADTALALIKDSVKAILRQALSEPQLLIDLKDC